MAVISAGKGSHSAAGSIKYVQFEKKSTKPRIIFSEGIECSPYYKDAIQDFKCVRDTFQKHSGREAHHMVLSFSEDEEQRYTQEDLFFKAVDIAKSTFPNYQIWLGMHDDTDHLHVHMVINSINLEDGKKMQIAGRKGMHEIMEKVQNRCNELGLDQVLPVGEHIQEEGRVVTHNIAEYKLIERGESWKLEMAKDILETLHESTGRDEFIVGCNERGIRCNWEETRKYVTFSYMDDSKKKARGSNLAKTFTLSDLESKESMERVFFQNRECNDVLFEEYIKFQQEETQTVMKKNISLNKFKRTEVKGMQR